MIPLPEIVRVTEGYMGWAVRLTFGRASALVTGAGSETEALCVAANLAATPRIAWAVLEAHTGEGWMTLPRLAPKIRAESGR